MTDKIISGPRVLMKEHVLAIVALTFVVLLGYHKVFGGGHVFLYEDYVAISNFSFGNSLGNGWRPDKGLGVSAFFGDGMWHPWSPLSLWERLMPSRTIAYNSSVILLGILAAVMQYFFIRKVVPQMGYWMPIFLAPMVVFCCDQGGYHFLRLSISMLIGIPWLIMVVQDHLKKPSMVNLLLAGLIFTFVMTFGNCWSLTQLVALGFFFMLSYCFYNKGSWNKAIKDFALLYGAGAAIFILLSAWILYSFLYESFFVGYMREKVMIAFSDIHFSFNLSGAITFLLGALFADWLPLDHNIAGIGYRLFLPAFNVNMVFPLVFISFLFRRSENFWEYSLKLLVSLFFIHNFFLRSNVFGYGDTYGFLSNKTSKLITMYDIILPLQVGLIAIYVHSVSDRAVIISKRWGRMLQRSIAGVLVCFYSVLFCAGLLTVFFSDHTIKIVHFFITEVVGRLTQRYPLELLEAVAAYNIKRFAEVMHWPTLFYYLSSALIAAVFLKDSWLKFTARLPKKGICLFLLVNALLMSWGVYPLSTKKLAWDNGSQSRFSPTDRFYYVAGNKSNRTLESFKEKYSQVEGGGYRQRQVGLLEPPGLNLSGLKSFETKLSGQFIYHIFNGDGSGRLTNLRLYYGGPVIFNELLNMSAVKYYYSDFKLKDLPTYVTPFFHTKQLYIYKNERAWPYFYLAQKLGVKNEDEHLKDVERGTAYLDKEDMFDLSAGAGKGRVTLKQFTYGKMIFDADSKNEELLVLADAWHPFWKAKTEQGALPVVRANEVFKGVRLPSGHHEVTVYFDPSPYRAGVYVSLISWVVFILGFVWAVRTRSELRV